jgi:hypothetical protein
MFQFTGPQIPKNLASEQLLTYKAVADFVSFELILLLVWFIFTVLFTRKGYRQLQLIHTVENTFFKNQSHCTDLALHSRQPKLYQESN